MLDEIFRGVIKMIIKVKIAADDMVVKRFLPAKFGKWILAVFLIELAFENFNFFSYLAAAGCGIVILPGKRLTIFSRTPCAP